VERGGRRLGWGRGAIPQDEREGVETLNGDRVSAKVYSFRGEGGDRGTVAVGLRALSREISLPSRKGTPHQDRPAP
jgi:hypothetical protein